MKVTKIVTRAILYDTEKGGQSTRVFIGRLTRRKVENIAGRVCIKLDTVKAEITIPDAVVEQYANIQFIVNPAAVADYE